MGWTDRRIKLNILTVSDAVIHSGVDVTRRDSITDAEQLELAIRVVIDYLPVSGNQCLVIYFAAIGRIRNQVKIKVV